MAEKKDAVAATENKDGKRSVTCRFEPELYNHIEQLAKEDERPISQYVERFIRKSFGTKAPESVNKEPAANTGGPDAGSYGEYQHVKKQGLSPV